MLHSCCDCMLVMEGLVVYCFLGVYCFYGRKIDDKANSERARRGARGKRVLSSWFLVFAMAPIS